MKTSTLKFLVILATLLALPCASQSAPPKNWQKSVVMLEKRGSPANGELSFMPHGTGFIFHDTLGFILITNRHILRGRDTIFVRFTLADFDPKHDATAYFRVPCLLTAKDRTILWTGHPDTTIDIAAIRLQWPGRKVDIAFFESKQLRSFETLEAGEDVYFYGFPLLLLGLQGKGDFPILRSGIVSYKAFQCTFIEGQLIDSGSFLVDGFSFPGNSGSPVVVGASGKKPFALVGIVIGHLSSYTDYPIQPDSFPLTLGDGSIVMAKPLPFNFTCAENAGLALVASADRIRQVIELLK